MSNLVVFYYLCVYVCVGGGSLFARQSSLCNHSWWKRNQNFFYPMSSILSFLSVQLSPSFFQTPVFLPRCLPRLFLSLGKSNESLKDKGLQLP